MAIYCSLSPARGHKRVAWGFAALVAVVTGFVPTVAVADSFPGQDMAAYTAGRADYESCMTSLYANHRGRRTPWKPDAPG